MVNTYIVLLTHKIFKKKKKKLSRDFLLINNNNVNLMFQN